MARIRLTEDTAMPHAPPDDTELVPWFTTDDLDRAEVLVSRLARDSIKAVIRPVPFNAYADHYQVWLMRSDLTGAQASLKKLEKDERAHGGSEETVSGEPDIPFGHPARRMTTVGCILTGVGFVLLSFSAAAGVCLIMAGILIVAFRRGLARFQQFQLIDLFALSLFLPASIGLTVAHTGTDQWTTKAYAIMAGLILSCILVWMGMIGAMNRIFYLSFFERLAVWLPLSLVLGLAWFLIWAVAAAA